MCTPETEAKRRGDAGSEDATQGAAKAAWELRVALVLYGGVSLAVYENGVTRAFHDLVKQRGAFGPLCKLLGVEPVVDVIAGTSAGGINGLLLGVALECGTELSGTADLWRREGDLGRLVRPVDEAGAAESLLDGARFQAKLEEAFKSLLREGEPDCPSEMDVFLTGTSLTGATWTWTDYLGSPVEELDHRVLFRLKYRPGRRRLGVPAEKSLTLEARAAALASMARITSSFPLAFPPFRIADLEGEDRRRAVTTVFHQAIHRAGTRDAEDDEMVDGGVLHNMPFEPALQAIFERMPRGRPLRRFLFFVDPDPKQLTPVTPPSERAGRTSPVGVAAKALVSIPGYQSIRDSLSDLESHNRLIDMLDCVRREARKSTARPVSAPSYEEIRREMLALYLASEDEEPPTLSTRIDPAWRVAARKLIEDSNPAELQPYDTPYLQRKTAYLLYELFERDPESAEVEDVAKVFQALEIVFSGQIRLRNEHRRQASKRGTTPEETMRSLRDAMDRYLGTAWWAEKSSVAAGEGAQQQSLLSQTALKVVREILTRAGEDPKGDRNVLEILDRYVEGVARAQRVDPRAFALIDEAMLPMQFTAGCYSLDKITTVKVNPSSAQKGYSEKNGADKVTGDDLAHFAAFFRRDWRSNDVTWGRLDGTCRIVEALLSEERGFAKVLRARMEEPAAWPAVLTTGGRPKTAKDLANAWASRDVGAFRDAVIRLEQERILDEEAVRVEADTVWQDATWRDEEGPKQPGGLAGWATSVVTSEPVLRERLAAAAVAPLSEGSAKRFLDANRGAQTVLGRERRVPRTVLVQYLTQAYLLLWGMVERSLAAPGGEPRGVKGPRAFLRSPVELVHRVVEIHQEDRRLFDLILFGAVVVQVGAAGACFWWEEPWRALLLLATAACTAAVGRSVQKRPLQAVAVGAIVLAGGALLLKLLPDWLESVAAGLADTARWLRDALG